MRAKKVPVMKSGGKITKEQASRAYGEAGSLRGAARKLGVGTNTIKRALGKDEKTVAKKKNIGPAKGLGLDELRDQFDQDTIIRRAIDESLERLGDAWLPESVFVNSTENLTPYKWGLYREHYEEHVIEVPGKKRIVAGTVEFAEKCREILT